LTKFYELLETYKELQKQIEEIKEKIDIIKTIGNKQIYISSHGVSIIKKEPYETKIDITLSFDEVKELFKFLKEKGVLE